MQSTTTETEHAATRSLSFLAGGVNYLISTAHVQRVHPAVAISPFPPDDNRSLLCGCINRNGRIIPVIDLKGAAVSPEDFMIFVESAGLVAALLVEKIDQVMSDEVPEAPRGGTLCLKNLTTQATIVLDLEDYCEFKEP